LRILSTYLSLACPCDEPLKRRTLAEEAPSTWKATRPLPRQPRSLSTASLFERLEPDIAPTSKDLAQFSNPASPQAKAFAWLKQDSIANRVKAPLSTILERYALAVVNYTARSDVANFLTADSVCTWDNVYCNAGKTTVTKFYGLKVKKGYPKLPWELVFMPNLKILQHKNQGWGVPIPPRLAELKKLRSLDLSQNWLDGKIPSVLGTLPQLKFLSLNENYLSGTIPTTLGNLNNLLELDLTSNYLSGSILVESLGKLNKLVTLDLGANQFTGGIPVELGSLIHLEVLRLYSIDFGGTIPDLSPLKNLRVLVLSDNNLSGTLPDNLGTFHNLEYLGLAYNDLTGTIPEAIGGSVRSRPLRIELQWNELAGDVSSYCEAYAPVKTSQLYVVIDCESVDCSCPKTPGVTEGGCLCFYG